MEIECTVAWFGPLGTPPPCTVTVHRAGNQARKQHEVYKVPYKDDRGRNSTLIEWFQHKQEGDHQFCFSLYTSLL